MRHFVSYHNSEKMGYDVSYISNVDTHADPNGLLRARAWLSVGHDEYWSLEMFNNVRAAVAQVGTEQHHAGKAGSQPVQQPARWRRADEAGQETAQRQPADLGIVQHAGSPGSDSCFVLAKW